MSGHHEPVGERQGRHPAQDSHSAATSRLSPRAMLHRWAFMVMCWAGGVTIAVTWHGRTADWIGGMVYGIGIGRLILRDD